MILKDARNAIAHCGIWLSEHKAGDVYSEGSQRMSAIGRRFVVPIVSDCSAFVTVCYNWAGAPDPNHLHYDHEGYCFTPETRILRDDLRWVPSGELSVGDGLWAFEETARGRRRTLERATVTASFLSRKECVRVTMQSGESFVCSDDHPWLSSRGTGSGVSYHEWVPARDLMSRPSPVRAFMPWEEDRSYDAGWLAGMFDGEGWVVRHGIRDFHPSAVGITQVLGATANRLERAVRERGDFNVRLVERPEIQKRLDMVSRGGISSAAEFLGLVRAERLIENLDLAGCELRRAHSAKIVSVEPVGEAEVQSIQTTSGTYFAEGFAVHNTGTLLSAGEHLALFRINGRGMTYEEVEPGDVVVFGPGTGVHTALVVSKGNGDPVCISMGRQGDPSIVTVSQMASLGEQTYLRFNTMTRKVHYPPGHKKL